VRLRFTFGPVEDGRAVVPVPRRSRLGRFDFLVNVDADPVRIRQTLARIADNILYDREHKVPLRRRLYEDVLPTAARAATAAGVGLVSGSIAAGAVAGIGAGMHAVGRYLTRLHQLRLNDSALNKALTDTHNEDVSPQSLRERLDDQRAPVHRLEQLARDIEQRLAADPRTADQVAALRQGYGDLPPADTTLLSDLDRRMAALTDLPRGGTVVRIADADHTFRLTFKGSKGRPEILTFEVGIGSRADTPVVAHRVDSDVTYALRVDPTRPPEEIARGVHDWLRHEIERISRGPSGLPGVKARLLTFLRDTAGQAVASTLSLAVGLHPDLGKGIATQSAWTANAAVGAGAGEMANAAFDGHEAVSAQTRAELVRRHFGTASEEHLAVFSSDAHHLLDRTALAYDRLQHLERIAATLPPGERPDLFQHGPVTLPDQPVSWGGMGFDPADADPTPRPGETADQAADRAELARMAKIYNELGDEPPLLDVASNDAHNQVHGAHTLQRHGPDVPLHRASGVRTIEGRIYGDPPWPNVENYSYRWLDHGIMNQAVNDYVQANWATIRSDLALDGQHRAVFDAGSAVGEGFFNSGMHGFGPRIAQYHKTSLVRLMLKLVPGADPARAFIVTAFPTGRGL